MKSKILVFLQFFIIFLMIFLPFGEPVVYPFIAVAIALIGGLIGLAAIKEQGRGNFNIRPDLKENCRLVTSGIYGYVRHPMYLSVLVLMLSVVLLYPYTYEYILYLLLVFVLITKMFYEEYLWQCHTVEYERYKSRVKRIIPYIF
jgi:protein-S-isoprenylcysteine O-methyltransferase Ste14